MCISREMLLDLTIDFCLHKTLEMRCIDGVNRKEKVPDPDRSISAARSRLWKIAG